MAPDFKSGALLKHLATIPPLKQKSWLSFPSFWGHQNEDMHARAWSGKAMIPSPTPGALGKGAFAFLWMHQIDYVLLHQKNPGALIKSGTVWRHDGQNERMEKMIANTVINLHSLLLSKLYQDSNIPSSVRRTLRSSLKITQHCSKSSCLPLKEVNKKTKPVVMMDQMYKNGFCLCIGK